MCALCAIKKINKQKISRTALAHAFCKAEQAKEIKGWIFLIAEEFIDRPEAHITARKTLVWEILHNVGPAAKACCVNRLKV